MDPILETSEEKITRLETELAQSQKSLEALNAVNNDLQNTIEEMELASSNSTEIFAKKVAPKVVLPTKSFKVDGVDYVFTVPQFTNPLKSHSTITAEQALTDKELLSYLVSNDCGLTKRKGE